MAVTLLFFFFFLITTPSSFSLTLNLPTIGPNEARLINLTGSGGSAYISDGIQVTPNSERNVSQNSLAGRATYIDPLYLWDRASGNLTDFTTSFTFVINSWGNNDAGDGLTFFLAPIGSSLEAWSLGASIGIGNGIVSLNSSSNQFVAVEFDTFRNYFDPNGTDRHVGIDINSMVSVNTTPWFNNISAGIQNDVRISYNASSMMLSVDFTGFWNNTRSTGSLSYVVDLREFLPEYVIIGFSAATGSSFETHTVMSWNFSSSLEEINITIPGPGPATVPVPVPGSVPVPEDRTMPVPEDRTGLIVGLSVAVIFGVALAGYCLWKKKYKKSSGGGDDDEEEDPMDPDMDMEFEKGSGAKKFSYKELVLATQNFAEEEKLGEGGFGGVYKGFLTDSDSYIAVKRVSRGSKQGLKEYASEVKIISQLRHRNLVQLLGWCHQRGELLLVYEFMPNGSLDSHLFKSRSVLAWEVRYKIARGLASALLYLHEGWERCVVHRDLKSSNIMLDSSFNVKLGDFGLARLVDHEKGSQTTVLAGTMGYMAPECVITGRASKETDVYSFGIVLLEIACGRRPVEHRCREKNQVVLLEWVWSLYGNGKLTDAADPNLSNEFDESEMEQLMIVGLWCAHPDSSHRPSIRQAIHVLHFEVELPVLPPTLPVPTYWGPSTSGLLSGTDSSNYYKKYSSSSSDYVTSSSEGNSTALLRTV